MSFFMSDALATPAAQAPANDGMLPLLMVIGVVLFIYFLQIRPQRKRMKEYREMIGNIRKGDEIITSGGIVAKVTQVSEAYFKVMVSEGVELIIQSNAISTVVPKGTLKSL